MQRYNPPTTSAQMYCHGCQRQIRKVQQVMDEKYLDNICYHVEKNKLELRLAKAESELKLEKCKVETMNIVIKKPSTSVETDEQVKEIMEVNKKLTEELQKASMPPTEYPLEEWYDAIDSKWREKYEQLKDYALDKKEEVEEYQDLEKNLKDDIYKYRREVNYLKRLLMLRDQEILDLKEASNKDKKSESMEKENKENGKLAKTSGDRSVTEV